MKKSEVWYSVEHDLIGILSVSNFCNDYSYWLKYENPVDFNYLSTEETFFGKKKPTKTLKSNNWIKVCDL